VNKSSILYDEVFNKSLPFQKKKENKIRWVHILMECATHAYVLNLSTERGWLISFTLKQI